MKTIADALYWWMRQDYLKNSVMGMLKTGRPRVSGGPNKPSGISNPLAATLYMALTAG